MKAVITNRSGVVEELRHLGDAPDVLLAIARRKAQISVQTLPDVVAVQDEARRVPPRSRRFSSSMANVDLPSRSGPVSHTVAAPACGAAEPAAAVLGGDLARLQGDVAADGLRRRLRARPRSGRARRRSP